MDKSLEFFEYTIIKLHKYLFRTFKGRKYIRNVEFTLTPRKIEIVCVEEIKEKVKQHLINVLGFTTDNFKELSVKDKLIQLEYYISIKELENIYTILKIMGI